jgi:hypothetical protein
VCESLQVCGFAHHAAFTGGSVREWFFAHAKLSVFKREMEKFGCHPVKGKRRVQISPRREKSSEFFPNSEIIFARRQSSDNGLRDSQRIPATFYTRSGAPRQRRVLATLDMGIVKDYKRAVK